MTATQLFMNISRRWSVGINLLRFVFRFLSEISRDQDKTISYICLLLCAYYLSVYNCRSDAQLWSACPSLKAPYPTCSTGLWTRTQMWVSSRCRCIRLTRKQSLKNIWTHQIQNKTQFIIKFTFSYVHPQGSFGSFHRHIGVRDARGLGSGGPTAAAATRHHGHFAQSYYRIQTGSNTQNRDII